MKLQLLQENLDQALKTIAKAVPGKPQLPILSTVLLSVVNGEVLLSATDLYLGIRARVPASIEAEGSVAVPAKVFIDTIRSLSPGKISLELAGSSLKISSAKTKSSLQVQAADDFPDFPDPSGNKTQVLLDQLEQIDALLSFCVSADQARLILTTLLFRPNETSLEIVATDGFRLGVLKLDQASPVAEEVLIPAKALSEVVKIARQQKVEKIEFSVSQELKQLFFSMNDNEVFVRLVEGQFPPYQKIMPSEFATELTVDGAELQKHLKQAQVFARESSNIVKLELAAAELTITAASTAHGSFQAQLSASNVTGVPEASIAFNARYLMEFLTKVKPQLVWIGLSDPLKPAMFRPAEQKNYSYVVMPFRVNE
jgi:DNA polymerase III subunit beta